MALETRPFPVLTGQAAKDFLEKVENFKTPETKKHIRECNRKYGKMIEEAKRNKDNEYQESRICH